MWKDDFPKENRYFETENGILYCGDAFTILPQLPKKKIDLLLTDPPYQISTNAGGIGGRRPYLKEIKEAGLHNGINFDFLDGFENWMVFCSKKQLLELLNIAYSRIGYKWDLIVLLKKNPPPLVNNTFLPDTEYIVFSRKPGRLFGGYKDKFKYILITVKKRKQMHPTTKPLEAIQKLIINGSQKGEIILDPFLGSGTTAVACEQLNRRWIGIEINEEYCEIAKRRLSKIQSRLL